MHQQGEWAAEPVMHAMCKLTTMSHSHLVIIQNQVSKVQSVLHQQTHTSFRRYKPVWHAPTGGVGSWACDACYVQANNHESLTLGHNPEPSQQGTVSLASANSYIIQKVQACMTCTNRGSGQLSLCCMLELVCARPGAWCKAFRLVHNLKPSQVGTVSLDQVIFQIQASKVQSVLLVLHMYMPTHDPPWFSINIWFPSWPSNTVT